MDSAITPLLKLSFCLQNCIYYLWYPFLIKVDHNSDQLTVTIISKLGALIPWFTVQIAAFFLHACLPVRILLQGLSSSNPHKLTSSHAAVLLIYAIYETMIVSILFLIRKDIKHLSICFSRLLEMEQNIIQGKQKPGLYF